MSNWNIATYYLKTWHCFRRTERQVAPNLCRLRAEHVAKVDIPLDERFPTNHVAEWKGTTMVSTSNDGIMSEYLLKFGALKSSDREHPTDLLETLYVSERLQAGDDLQTVRANYDNSVWNRVPRAEMVRRLAALDEFMSRLARNRAAMWGLN